MLCQLRRTAAQLFVTTCLAVAFGGGVADAQDISRLEIMAPSGPGGGYDMTARSIQKVMAEEKLARGIQVVNVSGASGTVGLAQFVTTKKGRHDALLVVGLVLEGGILKNKSSITLDDVTPLARLIGEYDVLVVPATSDLKTLDDLVAKLKADPGSVSWGGGGAGGVDHILAGLIGKAVGVDPTKINYIAHDGGGQALSSILGGHVTVGVNGLQEMLPLVQSGKLRALAVSSPDRLEGVDIPTLKEQGVDVDVVNWRGVVAPPNINDTDKKKLADAVGEMIESSAWKDLLKERGWVDLHQSADEFSSFIKEDIAQTTTVLTEMGLLE